MIPTHFSHKESSSFFPEEELAIISSDEVFTNRTTVQGAKE
jgi:hypothetical protein